MLIGLVGLRCAGKSTVAEYLCREHGFEWITFRPTHAAGGAHGLPLRHFASAEDMLQYVTMHWRSPFVTLDLDTAESIAHFEKRPFFLLAGVEAPMLLRWSRARAREPDVSAPLESLAVADDVALYGNMSAFSTPALSDTDPDTSGAAGDVSNLSILRNSGVLVSTSLPSSGTALAPILAQCQMRITNQFASTAELHQYLDTLSLPSKHRVRPTWDTYFLSLCNLASLRSNCMKRRVGAVIVRKNRVLSTGYNGTPRGLTNCNEGGCTRCNGSALCGAQLDECLCLHAEENALLELGRDRGGAEGTLLYCNTCPCLRCAVKIVQTGVSEVVYQLEYSMDGRSAQIFYNAGVAFRKYEPPF
ncbi:dCMP deaminase [Malassezia sp. CBS 17886]|nr:dCMP deaminase [Malassezia sp. CBS 17886]